MRVTVELNMANINAIEKKFQRAIRFTAEEVKEDLKQSQTIPFGEDDPEKHYKGGNLQNDQTFVDTSKLANNEVYIVSDTPYARRLYFHPEFDFYKGKNPNAGAKWFKPYISGNKKKFVEDKVVEFMRGGK